MLKSYYHATPFENLNSIFEKGILKGCDGVVYLTKEPDAAAKFVAIRGYKKILVIEVELEDDMVEESFDHSFLFFKCRAYDYPHDISVNEFGNNIKTYEI